MELKKTTAGKSTSKTASKSSKSSKSSKITSKTASKTINNNDKGDKQTKTIKISSNNNKTGKRKKNSSGKVIIEKYDEIKNNEEKYANRIKLLVARIKSLNAVEPDHIIRFGWKH